MCVGALSNEVGGALYTDHTVVVVVVVVVAVVISVVVVVVVVVVSVVVSVVVVLPPCTHPIRPPNISVT